MARWQVPHSADGVAAPSGKSFDGTGASARAEARSSPADETRSRMNVEVTAPRAMGDPPAGAIPRPACPITGPLGCAGPVNEPAPEPEEPRTRTRARARA